VYRNARTVGASTLGVLDVAVFERRTTCELRRLKSCCQGAMTTTARGV
jgi:hypothetical protein